MTIVFQQVFCARELHERCFPLDITRIAFSRGINHLRKQVYYDSISHWAQHLNWTSVGRSKYVKTQSERQLDVHWTYRRILNVQWTFSLGAVPSGIYIYIYIYIYIPLLRIKAWILVWICSIPTQLEWTHPLVASSKWSMNANVCFMVITLRDYFSALKMYCWEFQFTTSTKGIV